MVPNVSLYMHGGNPWLFGWVYGTPHVWCQRFSGLGWGPINVLYGYFFHETFMVTYRSGFGIRGNYVMGPVKTYKVGTP